MSLLVFARKTMYLAAGMKYHGSWSPHIHFSLMIKVIKPMSLHAMMKDWIFTMPISSLFGEQMLISNQSFLAMLYWNIFQNMQQKQRQDLRATVKCYRDYHKVPFQKHLLVVSSGNSLQKPLQIETFVHKKYAICYKSYLSLFAAVHSVLWMSTGLFSNVFRKILKILVRYQTLSLRIWTGLPH